MEKKGLKYVIFGLVTLLSLSSILLFSFVPINEKLAEGIPGLEVSLVQERIYSTSDSQAIVECFLDTSNMDLEFPIGVKFTTNSTIYGRARFHISTSIGYVDHVIVTLNVTSVYLGETIEVAITLSCGLYSQIVTAYVIVI